MNVVENDRFSEAWRFCKPHIARNYALEDLRSEESAQIGGNLAGKCGALVKHGKQDSFHFKAGVQSAPDAHQGIKQLGDAFKSQVFALNGNKHRTSGHKRVQGKEIQSGRAIQDDVPIFIVQSLQGGLEQVLAIL